MPETSNPTTPNQPVPAAALQLTPNGTPVVPPGQQIPQLSPEIIALLNTALKAMPPGAGKQILKQYWGYILALVLPLVLTTWTNLREIWAGPQQLAAVREEYQADHEAVEALERKVAEIEGKLDQVLLILNRGAIGGSTSASGK